MKTFKDLDFKPHAHMPGLQAELDFDNGYGISVVRFKCFGKRYGSYTNDETEWECAVMHEGDLCYDSGVTEDVIGYLHEPEVSDLMKQIQELPKK